MPTSDDTTDTNARSCYLFSLDWIEQPSTTTAQASSSSSIDPDYYWKKEVRTVWNWKDTVLGDGRDFFVPKPKTLQTLQHYILQHLNQDSKGMPVLECSILSNCARLEIVLVVVQQQQEHQQRILSDTDTDTIQQLGRELSNCIKTQVDFYNDNDKNTAWFHRILQVPVRKTDRPHTIFTTKPPASSTSLSYPNWWTVTVGYPSILQRLCKVSAGMASRPNRPTRSVIFRPFSSRDAHILLQFKRTKETISYYSDVHPLPTLSSSVSLSSPSSSIKNSAVVLVGVDDDNYSRNNTSTTPRKPKHYRRKVLPLLYECVLRAGKAARNVDIVPDIDELKDWTAAESSFATVTEQQRNTRICISVYETAIRPLIDDYVIKLDDCSTASATNIDAQIAKFRNEAVIYLQEIIATRIHDAEEDEEKIIRTRENNDNDNEINNNNETVNDKNKNENKKDNDNTSILPKTLRSWLNRRLHAPTIEVRALSRRQRQQKHESREDVSDVADDSSIDIESFLADSLEEIKTELEVEYQSLQQRRVVPVPTTRIDDRVAAAGVTVGCLLGDLPTPCLLLELNLAETAIQKMNDDNNNNNNNNTNNGNGKKTSSLPPPLITPRTLDDVLRNPDRTSTSTISDLSSSLMPISSVLHGSLFVHTKVIDTSIRDTINARDGSGKSKIIGTVDYHHPTTETNHRKHNDANTNTKIHDNDNGHDDDDDNIDTGASSLFYLGIGLANHLVGGYYWARGMGIGASLPAHGVVFSETTSALYWTKRTTTTTTTTDTNPRRIKEGPTTEESSNSNDGKRSEWADFVQVNDTVQLVPNNAHIVTTMLSCRKTKTNMNTVALSSPLSSFEMVLATNLLFLPRELLS